MNKFLLNIFAIIIFITTTIYSQKIPFSYNTWDIQGNEHTLIDYLGRHTLYMKGAFAVLKDSTFLNGTIEYDIAFTNDRNFPSVFFRMVDQNNFEQFYVRPAQSGLPDATQYTPVFNGLAAWQLYHGPGHSSTTTLKFNEWNHIKIVVNNSKADIFINDMKEPAIFADELKRKPLEGQVGLTVPGLAGAYLSNFKITKEDAPKLVGKPNKIEAKHKNIIKEWKISNTFLDKKILGKTELTSDDFNKLKWKKLKSEKTGITNLARISKIDSLNNTVFVKLTVESNKDQIKKFMFGYSDQVHFYLNGKLLYSGTNRYRTRDFRYLGTIGLFDEVYLDLEDGENEIIMAITEAFGGWGVLGAFEDPMGITIN